MTSTKEVDKNGDGEIDFQEFFGCGELLRSAVETRASPRKWLQQFKTGSS